MTLTQRGLALFICILFAGACGDAAFVADSQKSVSKQRRAQKPAPKKIEPNPPPVKKRRGVPLDSPLKTPAAKEKRPPAPLIKPEVLPQAETEPLRMAVRTEPIPAKGPVEEARFALAPLSLDSTKFPPGGRAARLGEAEGRPLKTTSLALRPVNLSERPEAEELALALPLKELTDRPRREDAALVLPLEDLEAEPEPEPLSIALVAKDPPPRFKKPVRLALRADYSDERRAGEPAGLALPPAEITQRPAPAPLRFALPLEDKGGAAEAEPLRIAIAPKEIKRPEPEQAQFVFAPAETNERAAIEEAPFVIAPVVIEEGRGEPENLSLIRALGRSPFPADTQPVSLFQTDLDMKSVFFDVDSSDLSEESRAALDENMEHLENYPYSFSYIVLEGHCDSLGSENYNIRLGRERAKAVKQYLQERGVEEGFLVTVSYGEAMPASETDEAQNRRVSFTVIY